MSKSQLTKSIEKALTNYSPAKLSDFEINYRRHQYMEFEVPVTHSHIKDGLIDCVWLAEGYCNHRDELYCMAHRYLQYNDTLPQDNSCALTIDELKSIGSNVDWTCSYEGSCRYKRKIVAKDEAVACICFEIKISKADFHSKNGHNFIGNLNYYVMPFNLYKEVKDEIPEHIGCITYHYKDDDKIGRLIQQKASTYAPELDYALYTSLLHTFLNKSDKNYKKLQYAARDRYDKLMSASYQIIDDMIKRLRNEKEYSCFKSDGFGGCANDEWSLNENCSPDCPWTYHYRCKLQERMNIDAPNNSDLL